jgi:hypothetical protein
MRKSVGFVLAVLAWLSAGAHAGPTAYKVERVVYPRSDTYSDDLTGLSQPLAQIEIGASAREGQQIAPPAQEALASVLLIGTDGITAGTKFRTFEKRCEFLCGDELEECHHTALVAYDDRGIGTPLVALAGVAGDVSGFRKLEPAPPETDSRIQAQKQALAWPPGDFVSLELENGRVDFTAGHEGKSPYSYDASAPDCRTIDYPDSGLTRLSCNGVEFLSYENRPLLMSYADYNISTVQVLNEFRIDGRAHYTVLLALKAYNALGILIQGDSGWRFIVRPADWAMLC